MPYWPTHKMMLKHFAPWEFDHPELMDGAFLRDLDELRERCGFPLRVNDDARTQSEHEALYAAEIESGQPYPSDSPHLAQGDVKVRAVDLKPLATDDVSLESAQLTLTYEILRMWREGRWDMIGLGLESAHWHVDDTPRLMDKRPAFWVAVSR